MNSFVFTLNAVMPLFLLVMLGYILKRIGMFSDEWLTVANRFSFLVTLSVMMFDNIYSAESDFNFDTKLIAFAVLCLVTVTALSFAIVPLIVKERFKTGVVIQGIFRSNFLLFGIPLVINMFGDESKPLISLVIAIIIPLYNIFAVLTLTVFNKNSTGKLNIRKLFLGLITNPLIMGCLIGFIFRMLPFRLPLFVDNTLGQISDLAVPLALIILGAQFKFSGFVRNIKIVVSTVFLKLVAVPVLVIVLAVALGLRGVQLGVLIAMFSSPGAVSSSIMAYNMNCDGDLAGQIVVLGTAVSVFTMFITIFSLRTMSLL